MRARPGHPDRRCHADVTATPTYTALRSYQHNNKRRSRWPARWPIQHRRATRGISSLPTTVEPDQYPINSADHLRTQHVSTHKLAECAWRTALVDDRSRLVLHPAGTVGGALGRATRTADRGNNYAPLRLCAVGAGRHRVTRPCDPARRCG